MRSASALPASSAFSSFSDCSANISISALLADIVSLSDINCCCTSLNFSDILVSSFFNSSLSLNDLSYSSDTFSHTTVPASDKAAPSCVCNSCISFSRLSERLPRPAASLSAFLRLSLASDNLTSRALTRLAAISSFSLSLLVSVS